MCSRRSNSFGSKECAKGRVGLLRAHFRTRKGKGLKECALRSWRAHGALPNNEVFFIKASECAHFLFSLKGFL